jgi:hypothetical protein
VDPETEETVINDQIVIKGYEGYKKGLVLLIEALGGTIQLDEDGAVIADYDVVIETLFNRVDEILNAPKPVAEILKILPNLVYFINANGLTASVNNTILAVTALYNGVVTAIGKEPDLNALLANVSEYLTLDDLSFDMIYAIVKDKTGLDLETPIGEYIKTFKMGSIDKYTSASGDANAKRMTVTNTRDVLTVVASLLLEVMDYEDNQEALQALLGEDAYQMVYSILHLKDIDMTYLPYVWNYYVADADPEDDTYTNGIGDGSNFPNKTGVAYLTYYNDWKPETAAALDENLEAIVNDVLAKFDQIELDTLTKKLGEKLYTEDTVKALMNLLSGLLEKVPAELLELIGEVVDVDFSGLIAYDAETAHYDVTDKASFIDVLFGENGVLTPFDRVFRFLLLGTSYEFFTSALKVDDEGVGESFLIIPGALGYEKGLAPLMEALGIDAPAVEDAEGSGTALMRNVADAILTRVEYILSVDHIIPEVLSMLPELLYFIDANGLTAAANNTLAAVTTLIDIVADLLPSDEGEEGNSLSSINDTINSYIGDLSFRGIAGLVEELTGIVIPENIIGYVETNRVGELEGYTSAAYGPAYRVTAAQSTEEARGDRADVITCLLSAAIETVVYGDNAAKLDELLGTNVVAAVVAVLHKGVEFDTESAELQYNWDYNEYDDSTTYLSYKNNWNAETATYVNDNLDSIVNAVIHAVDSNYDSLSAFAKDKLYSVDTINAIGNALKSLAETVDGALSGFVGAKGAETIFSLLGVNVAALKNYTETTDTSINGNRTAFVTALVNMLKPLTRLFDFLLKGDGYEFFVDSNSVEGAVNDQIVIKGYEGYKKGLVLLIEALGGTVSKADYAKDEDIISGVLNDLFNRVDAILNADKPVEEVLKILPNLIYFINANGLTASVNNTILAVTALYNGVVTAIGKEADLDKLLGFPISDLSFDTIFTLVQDKTGLNLKAPIGEYIETFKMGTIAGYTSASGDTNAKRMTVTDTRDVLTVVASLLLEVCDYRGNQDALKNLLGEKAYQLIWNVLNMTEIKADMLKIQWTDTNKANTGEVISPLDTSLPFNPYGPLFTREMAQYIADNLDDFIDNIVQLLGIEINGKFATSLEDLLNNVVGNTLYTKANLEKIYGYVKSAVDRVDGLPASSHIKQVLKKSIAVDLTAYDNYAVADITDGNRDQFRDELVRMIRPLYGALKWLLTDQQLAFFVDKDNEDQVILPGAEGYKYGIVPVLEALLCTGVEGGNASFASTIMSQEDYVAAVRTNEDVLLTAILDPVFDKLDAVLANPAEELFNLIPNVQYFVNCGALDTCFHNILNAVYTLMGALEPAIGKVDIIKDVLKIDLSEMTMASLVNLLVSSVSSGTGLSLEGMDVTKLLQCFNGTLWSYTNSKSGENPAYYVCYAGEASKADTIAVILQMLLQWIAAGDNPAKLKQIIREKVDMSDEGYAYADKLIDIVAAYCKTPSGTDSILHMLYYIFYAAYTGTTKVANWQSSYNGRLELVAEGEVAASKRDENLGKVAELLDWLFVTYGDGDGDDTGNVYHNYDNPDDEMPSPAVGKPKGFAPNGFIAFFRQIIEWFKTIFNKIFKH